MGRLIKICISVLMILGGVTALMAQNESFDDLFNFGEEVQETKDSTGDQFDSLFGDSSDSLVLDQGLPDQKGSGEGDVVIKMLEKKEIPRQLALTLSLASPTYVSTDLMTWNSYIDGRFSIEFPMVLFGVIPGFSVATFKFENALPVGGVYKGVSMFGTVSRPLFPGKISVGAGVVGSSPGAFIQQGYEFTFWDRLILGADFRLTWTSAGPNGGAVSWFDIGFTPGLVAMKIK